MKLLGELRRTRALHHTLGTEGMRKRLGHEVRKRTGRFRALRPKPAPPSRQKALQWRLPEDFYADEPMLCTQILAKARRLLAGELNYFSAVAIENQWPPLWHRNPFVHRELPRHVHWSQLSTSYSETGDIKWVWEASRFSFASLLARAHVAAQVTPNNSAEQGTHATTAGTEYARELFSAIRDWRRSNPFGHGANWQCGQEASLRYLAISFATATFEDLGEDSTESIQLAYETGRRVFATLDYALSQRNNHAITELTALWFISQQFPDWDESRLWAARVVEELPRVLRDQFLPDGSYIQDSFHYQRLALQLLLFIRAAATQWNVSVPAQQDVDDALRVSYQFLLRFVDQQTGCVPNSGHNDGTHLFALTECDYNDFRPLMCHLATAIGESYPCNHAPAREEAAWFGYKPQQEPDPVAPTRLPGDTGYLSSWRLGDLVFARAPHHHHHRPWHADALHVDIHAAGKRITVDPGTYLYTAPAPWQGALQRTRVHNTCSVDDIDQMRLEGKFLWSEWSHAHVEFATQNEKFTAWGLRVYADWQHTVLHRRLVIHSDGFVRVMDQLRSSNKKKRTLRLHWNLLDTAWSTSDTESPRRAGAHKTRDVEIEASAVQEFNERIIVGGKLQENDNNRTEACDVLGWWSPSYGQKLPCTALELEVLGHQADFVTEFQWKPTPRPDFADLIVNWQNKLEPSR